jgi:hypothetical protein
VNPLSVSVTPHAGTGAPVVRLADVTARPRRRPGRRGREAAPGLLLVDLSAPTFIDSAALHGILQPGG